MTKVGINGFGRIGRQVLKSLVENYANDLEVVAINDLFDTKANAHLFKYDSTYGKFNGTVDVEGSDLVINGKNIKVFNEKDPANIPWGDLGVEIVIESTGIFTDAIGDPAKGTAHKADRTADYRTADDRRADHRSYDDRSGSLLEAGVYRLCKQRGQVFYPVFSDRH